MDTVIITGANGNLGMAVTQLFLDKGYRVLAVVAKNAKENFLKHDHLDVFVVDLADETAAAGFVRSVIDKYQSIHAALLLVGGFIGGNIASTSGEDISNQISLNFNTAYFVARPLLQQMKAQGAGRIVFIGSRPGLVASYGKDLVAYSLSKSLLFRLAEFINADARGRNVTATVIVPSTIDTPVNRKSMPDADPLNWVKPEDLAEIMEFVVSAKGAPLRETVLKVYNNS
jgi:NAD(P)-dependent dehydrogenase (short-subunit alcohol dehydrogenase family)